MSLEGLGGLGAGLAAANDGRPASIPPSSEEDPLIFMTPQVFCSCTAVSKPEVEAQMRIVLVS